MAPRFRIHLHQAEQEFEGQLALVSVQPYQDIVGAAAKDTGEPAMVSEQLPAQPISGAFLPQPVQRVLD